MCFCLLTIFADATLVSLEHITVFLIPLSMNPDIMLPMCSYKGQIEEITLSLNLLAMVLLMQPGMWLALIAAEAHCWLMFSLFSMRTSRSFSIKLFSSQPAPRLCFCIGLFFTRCGTSLFFLAKIHAVCDSPFLQRSLYKAALPSSKLIIPPPVWICLRFTHLKLQISTYRNKHQSSTDPREISLRCSHRWDFKPLTTTLWAWQSSHLATHLVVNTSSIFTRFDHLTTIRVQKIRLKTFPKSR